MQLVFLVIETVADVDQRRRKLVRLAAHKSLQIVEFVGAAA